MSCSNCKVNLVDVEYVEKDEKDFCLNCYNQLFGKFCAKCQMLILIGAKIAKYEGKFWHKDCFQCYSCQTKLTKFEIGDDKQVYCHTCHTEKYGPKCVVCCKAIVKSLRYVEAGGRLFHEDCFRCSSKLCTKKLENGFIPKDNQFFCPECYRDIISKHTFRETLTCPSLVNSDLFCAEEQIMKSKAQEMKTELMSTVQPVKKTLSIPRVPKDTSSLTATDETQTVSYLFPNLIMKATVHNGSIQLQSGELSKQTVDVIVVCSTSDILLKNVLQQAGLTVQNDYDRLSSLTNQQDSIIETEAGNLSCQAILFCPWTAPTDRDSDKLSNSVSDYMSKCLNHILYHSKVYRTAAFSVMGYGLSQCPMDIIAKAMINTAGAKLAETLLYFDISFFVPSNEYHVHQKFAEKLALIQQPSDPFGYVDYLFSKITLTLTAKQEANLKQCRSMVDTHIQSLTQTEMRTNEDLHAWTQHLVISFYKYCLDRHIWPMISFEQKKLTLTGRKDSIGEADKYFLELTNQALKQTHLQAISRSILWEYQIDGTTWQNYSYKSISEIEYAYSFQKLSSLDIINEQDEKCRIDFSNNTETFNDRIRSIRRQQLVSISLPVNWQCQSNNCSRFVLNEDTEEYKSIKQSFDQTMLNLYKSIKSIERIQNQRWYKQYAAHRDAMNERLKENTERRLFHGCNETAANSIIEECFNRAFAGVNGTVYGLGAYFATNAIYSNSFTRPDSAGVRCMFVASVLIGKTVLGKSSMKVPPPGYDSTTDNNQIFVVYHDAQAYADYLIKYQ
ncbi:unnamed protein product [Adineta ricciae]|uniref:Poly [ADP-ribose] polymerase n=1 Tax=Adineta ricciae TaxID=249248 RepID=A0A814J116_ADIRI|nr:unnamed protein product [Adineta ricciae]